jgi:alpha/beta superfamily hydrolase
MAKMTYFIHFTTVLFFLLSSMTFAQKEKTVSVENKQGKLEGTLLYPKKKNIPVVLIIAGSGATDRNGNQGMMKSDAYKLLAEGLADQGIASLRYDKQGIGESAGAAKEEKDLVFQDMVNDAGLFVDYLSEQKRFSEIILIGHSEGALVAKLLAQQKDVSKVVSVAGAGRPIGKILVEQITQQSEELGEKTADIIDQLLKGEEVEDVPQDLMALFRPSILPYLKSWLLLDPVDEVKKIDVPVCVVQGTTDLQVKEKDAQMLADAKENMQLVVIEGMNHVLKDAPEDRQENIMTYMNPKLPLSEGLVEQLSAFILK